MFSEVRQSDDPGSDGLKDSIPQEQYLPMDFNKEQEEGSRNDKGIGQASGGDRADGAAA